MRPNRRAATVSDEVDEFEMQAMAERVVDKGKLRDTCCDVERGKQEISDIIRTFKTDIDRVLSQSLHMEPAEVWSFSSTERQPSSTPLSPSNSDRTVATNQNQLPEPTRAAEAPSDVEPVIHVNVLCDNCQEVIIGVRHKCLDCAGLTSPLSFAALDFTDSLCVDFDLCSSCLATQPQNIGLHSRSHSLFAIEEPGGVWVHTVFTGDGTQDVPEPPATNRGPPEPPIPTPESRQESTTPTAEVAPPAHHASCDLCDSTINRDRYVSIIYTVSFECCTHAANRNVSTAQISIRARHATRSCPFTILITVLPVCVIRRT
jgi:next-to-BRCA1 protein 1